MLTGEEGEAALPALSAPGRDVVVTLGAGGLWMRPADGVAEHLPALAVEARSSHGAGDCFCGTLGARLAAGDGLREACRAASEAAARFVAGAA